jgi:hypothetical protein
VIIKISSLSNNGLNERPNIHTVGTRGTIFYGSQTTSARQAITQGLILLTYIFPWVYCSYTCLYLLSCSCNYNLLPYLDISVTYCCYYYAIALTSKSYPYTPEETNLLDSRANQILVAYFDGWYVFPSPEIFSRHSGTCIVLGDRKHTSLPREVEIGDCFRLGRSFDKYQLYYKLYLILYLLLCIGSVGLVVSEIRFPNGEEKRLDTNALQVSHNYRRISSTFRHICKSGRKCLKIDWKSLLYSLLYD